MFGAMLGQDEPYNHMYKLRAAAPGLPDFSVTDVAFCEGEVTEIEDEAPFDYYFLIVDDSKLHKDEIYKDRSHFISEDFEKYDILGEVLAETYYFLPVNYLLGKR